MRGYRDLADDLRRRIEEGEFSPGTTLPPITDLMDEYGMARQTVRAALAELANQGLVVVRRKLGTLVRDRRPIRVPLSRYGSVLQPGGAHGPWETACAQQGLNGEMRLVDVQRVSAPDDLASLLDVAPGSELVQRRRHALIDQEIVQVQCAWYPAPLADRAGIGERRKVVGGVLGALSGAGLAPAEADERVTSGVPTADEARQLQIGTAVPVLRVQRLTRAADGTPLEVLRVIAPADRIELVYDRLPLGGTA
ncbi:MAG TPA: GntR family transcriptional regulator [Streptomyces sp.]|uniref:GntR family transcriptional regulator n=1 Tax=Streptomyces sp. TaxID=1931 RepID=UPI002D25994C|nr:GntR family transcriptional regulator [Streptomyces sp.]HZG04111.1 GntR family transcriptional regulator [Streptomyces sp.]